MFQEDSVLISVDDHIGTLTLNRPPSRNALSLNLLESLDHALDAMESDPTVRVVVIAGNGPAFSAGHDLAELHSATPEAAEQIFNTCSTVMMRVSMLTKPVIAKVAGVATAAGCQLVASCDLAIASTSARFATPGVNIGLFCSTPAVPLARTIAPKHAMRMLLTGEMVSADEAHRIGLVNDVVQPEDLDSAVGELAATIAAKPSAVIRAGKSTLRHQMSRPLDDAYAIASQAMCEGLNAPAAHEGISAFLEKREPRWPDHDLTDPDPDLG